MAVFSKCSLCMYLLYDFVFLKIEFRLAWNGHVVSDANTPLLFLSHSEMH